MHDSKILHTYINRLFNLNTNVVDIKTPGIHHLTYG